MIGRSTRFSRWLLRDDRHKEQFVAEVEGGASDGVALERVGVTRVMLRAWMREDPEFSRAVRVARRGELGEPQFWDLGMFGPGEDPNTFPPPSSSQSSAGEVFGPMFGNQGHYR
jgi:hypothetical protein